MPSIARASDVIGDAIHEAACDPGITSAAYTVDAEAYDSPGISEDYLAEKFRELAHPLLYRHKVHVISGPTVFHAALIEGARIERERIEEINSRNNG